MNFDDPVATALRVARLLEGAEIPYALYGGLAVAAWGVARETKDADIAVISAEVEPLVALLRNDGIRTEAAFDRVRFGGLIVSRATLLGGEDDTGINTVDLVQPASRRYSVLALDRALRAPLRNEPIVLLAPEDVVVFKILSTRERDLEDAAAILRELVDDIDIAVISAEVERLAPEIAEHDVARRWNRCLGMSR